MPGLGLARDLLSLLGRQNLCHPGHRVDHLPARLIDERVVRVGGVVKPLTSHQFELLRVLAEAPGRVLSRGQIMERVRGEELEAFDRSIDVHVSRIRAAIEEDPREPKRIRTVRGAGYVFTPLEREGES